MGADAAHQQMVAVHQQVLGGDGGRQIGAPFRDKVGGIAGGDMLHQLERKLQQHGAQMTIDEDLLPVENIHVAPVTSPLHQQRHAELAQGLQHRRQRWQTGHRLIGMGGGPGRT